MAEGGRVAYIAEIYFVERTWMAVCADGGEDDSAGWTHSVAVWMVAEALSSARD